MESMVARFKLESRYPQCLDQRTSDPNWHWRAVHRAWTVIRREVGNERCLGTIFGYHVSTYYGKQVW